MLDGLDLKLHQHDRKRQSGHAQSSPNWPVTRNAGSQCFNKELPLVIDTKLVAAEEIYL